MPFTGDQVRNSSFPATIKETATRKEFILDISGGHTREVTIDAQAADAGNTGNTHKLRRGLLVAKITSGGNFKEYTPAASDGTETAVAVLMEDVDRPISTAVLGVVVNRVLLRASELILLDAAGRVDLKAVGCAFNDEP